MLPSSQDGAVPNPHEPIDKPPRVQLVVSYYVHNYDELVSDKSVCPNLYVPSKSVVVLGHIFNVCLVIQLIGLALFFPLI